LTAERKFLVLQTQAWQYQRKLESNIEVIRFRMKRQQELKDYDLHCSETRMKALEEQLYQQQQLHTKIQEHHTQKLDKLAELEKNSQAQAKDNSTRTFSQVWPNPVPWIPFCAENVYAYSM
jgi:hypothetical protein